MRAMASDWYKKIWTLDIRDLSWVEDTERQVDFLIDKMQLRGDEKILDLGCGFGRHSLLLAKRGFAVTGVDITPEYIEYAARQAQKDALNAHFICADIRELIFENEFDVALNMADGAIGYLENDAENQKIFQTVARALKPNGKHFMDIMNADYAEEHFPMKSWSAGGKCLTLSDFEWNAEKRSLLYGQIDIPYGDELKMPTIEEGNVIRLYSESEIRAIFEKLGMQICECYADFSGKAASDREIQLMVYSKKLQ